MMQLWCTYYLHRTLKKKRNIWISTVHSVTVKKNWTENIVLCFLQSMPSFLMNFSKSRLPTTRSKHIVKKKGPFFPFIFQGYNLEIFSSLSSRFIFPFSRYIFPMTSDYWCLWGTVFKQIVQTLIPAATSVSSHPLVMRSVVINFPVQSVGQQQRHMYFNVY